MDAVLIGRLATPGPQLQPFPIAINRKKRLLNSWQIDWRKTDLRYYAIRENANLSSAQTGIVCERTTTTQNQPQKGTNSTRNFPECSCAFCGHRLILEAGYGC
jgi:hypothetical protein